MSIFSIFTLLGGLAFFIYGMNQMSHSLEIIAGEKMEAIINKLTSNRFLGLFLGCVITIAIQSSSAVTKILPFLFPKIKDALFLGNKNVWSYNF